MDHLVPISETLTSFSPISLDDMDNVRLMNRTDIKYMISVSQVPDILTRMNGNYKALEINGSREFSYHTTYLDSPDYMFFNQHVTGKLSRNKVRFRKYETTGKTFLEVKKKTNTNRTLKWRIENNLAPDGTYNTEARDFIGQHIPQRPLELKPVLITVFKRATFVSSDVCERITLDYNISYTGTDGRNAGFPSVAVIEIKKDKFINRSRMTNILKESAVYPTAFSKYCIGTAFFNTQLRNNILKPRLLKINKLENEYYRIVFTC
jgi:hypothetical protein